MGNIWSLAAGGFVTAATGMKPPALSVQKWAGKDFKASYLPQSTVHSGAHLGAVAGDFNLGS